MKRVLFCLLSLADLSLTCWLLDNSGGQAYEANPLACWWLSRHGWLGLACFKLACMLTVLGLATVISRHRPRAGSRVLTFACTALASVVLYSAALCREAYSSPERRAAEEDRRLDRELGKAKAHQALMDRLAEGVTDGRLPLLEAAVLAGESERGRDPAFLEHLAHFYHGRTAQECLAASVIMHAIMRQRQPRVAWDLALRLEQEFYLSYGSPAPLRHRQGLGEPPAVEAASE